MALTILDLDDVESHGGQKVDRWLAEFQANFLRPVTDAIVSQRLQQLVGSVDPDAARKIHAAMGGSSDGE